MSSNLFPLKLTLWEEFFVVDDHDNYPANFMTRLCASGRISEELFLSAVSNCLAIHPLFACRLGKRGRSLYWEKSDDPFLPVMFSTGDREPGIPLLRRLNVFQDRLWRAEVCSWQDSQGKDRTDIFVEFHHALCDGLGAIQFISDVAQEIHRLHAGSQQAGKGVSKTDPLALRGRGRFPQRWKEFFLRLPFQYRSILAALRLMFVKVAALVPVDSVKALLDQGKKQLGYRKIILSTTESSRLRRRCRQRNTTVNSLLTAELFQAVVQWKKGCGHPDFKALRIMIPFNERDLKDARLPACNRVSLSPFTRKLAAIEDPSGLLASIEEGVRAIRKGRLGINFHRGLRVCKLLFGSLRRLAATDRVGATAVFANVGNLHAHLGLPVVAEGVACGPLTVSDIDLVPPLRIGTSFAMTLHEFNGETRLGIHYDSALVSAEEATGFFDLLRQRIRQLAKPDEAGSSSP